MLSRNITKFVNQNQATRQYSNYPKIRFNRTCKGLNIVQNTEIGLIERFGKYDRTLEPGLALTIPIVEKLRIISLKEVAIDIYPQSTVTKDNVQVETSGSVYFKIVDPYKACYETHDLMNSVITHAQAALRSACGSMELDTLFHDRNSLNKIILKSISEAAVKWGVEVNRYEITDVTPDRQVSKAMDSQSIAEREKRKLILDAEGQRSSDITISEGKKIAIINNAEADRQSNVLTAKAVAESLKLKAEAEATSMNMIGKALRDNPEAKEFILAKEYLNNVAKMLPKSSVFIPQDINDINKMVASATTINKTLKE